VTSQISQFSVASARCYQSPTTLQAASGAPSLARAVLRSRESSRALNSSPVFLSRDPFDLEVVNTLQAGHIYHGSVAKIAGSQRIIVARCPRRSCACTPPRASPLRALQTSAHIVRCATRSLRRFFIWERLPFWSALDLNGLALPMRNQVKALRHTPEASRNLIACRARSVRNDVRKCPPDYRANHIEPGPCICDTYPVRKHMMSRSVLCTKVMLRRPRR